jgi:hypothetical protein
MLSEEKANQQIYLEKFPKKNLMSTKVDIAGPRNGEIARKPTS